MRVRTLHAVPVAALVLTLSGPRAALRAAGSQQLFKLMGGMTIVESEVGKASPLRLNVSLAHAPVVAAAPVSTPTCML